MNFDTEQIRLSYQQQMKQLQEKLEVSVQNLQSSNLMISQQNSLIEQLQTQIVVLENTKIDHVAFKMQASEINESLGVVQLDLYQVVDIVQKYYQRINTSLKNIYDKEKEACAARSKFQEFIVWRQKVNFPGLAPFSQYEQMKGEMVLKVWETNLEERKKLAREVKEACLNALTIVESELVEFKDDVISDTLGQIEIEKNKENSMKNKESIHNTIQQVNQIDLQKIDELLVKPKLQHQVTAQAIRKIQEKLPLVHKRMFAFELNENIEPSKFVVALMEMCDQFNEQKKASTSASK
jgi:hypothetical protein